jgi:hypothetical protein
MPSGIYKRTKEEQKRLRTMNLGKKRPPRSEEWKRRLRENSVHRFGKKNPSWLGNKVGYHGIHIWLRKNFGIAMFCESHLIGLSCKRISKRFEWAKLRNKKYQRKRGNFIRLCKSCHSSYDYPEKKLY